MANTLSAADAMLVVAPKFVLSELRSQGDVWEIWMPLTEIASSISPSIENNLTRSATFLFSSMKTLTHVQTTRDVSYSDKSWSLVPPQSYWTNRGQCSATCLWPPNEADTLLQRSALRSSCVLPNNISPGLPFYQLTIRAKISFRSHKTAAGDFIHVPGSPECGLLPRRISGHGIAKD